MNIINGCIKLGLKWSISPLDLNTKMDYVKEFVVGSNGIESFNPLSIFALFLINT